MAVKGRLRRGMLTERDFNLLTSVLYKEEVLDSDLDELKDRGLIADGELTERAFELLSPFKVRRAIFLAAGIGNRLRPITINTPKPLVKVNGIRMIDTLLQAVEKAGIEEIIIVRGYLGEQLDILEREYKNIRFVDNLLYNAENNISSAILVKDYFENAYVLEADLVLNNQKLIRPYEYKSSYLGVYTDKTSDWCFETQEGRITKIKLGGENCHHMYGVSFWNEADGRRLRNDLVALYASEGGKQKFWDFAALEHNVENYSIFVRECTFLDIQEIDSFKELAEIDSSYKV